MSLFFKKKKRGGGNWVNSRVIRGLQKLEDVPDAEEVEENNLTGQLWLFISTQDANLYVYPL